MANLPFFTNPVGQHDDFSLWSMCLDLEFPWKETSGCICEDVFYRGLLEKERPTLNVSTPSHELDFGINEQNTRMLKSMSQQSSLVNASQYFWRALMIPDTRPQETEGGSQSPFEQ